MFLDDDGLSNIKWKPGRRYQSFAKTALEDMPHQWLAHMEKNIVRKKNCLLWQADTCDKDGWPYFNFREMWGPKNAASRNKRKLHRWIAELFFDFTNAPTRPLRGGGETWDAYCIPLCGNKTCVNPDHLLVTKYHPKQRLPLEKLRKKFGLKVGDFYVP